MSSPTRPSRLRAVAAIMAAAMVAGGCSADADRIDSSPTLSTGSTDAPVGSSPDCRADPDDCTLGELATSAGVVFGAATSSDRLAEPDYAATLSDEFNSLTAEREMKWDELQPAPGEFDFAGADEIVEFAQRHDMAVKGHTLIWEQDRLDATPDWVLQIADPDELRAVVRDHFEVVLGHFGDAVDRWDVVNEPLEAAGPAPYPNHFATVLGPGWLDEMFLLADEIAPDRRLFLNEVATELLPEKADAFFELVAGMVERGIPIDGVGLQAHLLAGTPEPGTITGLVERFSALGLEVALTELDLPAPDGADRFELQADGFAQVVSECLAAGCSEVTVWGVDDDTSWLDDFLGRDDTDPLLFDDDLTPKPAQRAIREVFAGQPGN